MTTTPINPELCKNTGRLLTEWFEFPEFTDEDLRALAMKREKADVFPRVNPMTGSHEEVNLMQRMNGFIAGFKARKWAHNMTKQEVAARLNEATKMIDPSNFKFLDDATRDRTGLEINPLWMMECLIRSGTLSPKEQVSALKELAQYTHSKAPNINNNTNINIRAPEDWLVELGKADYAIVDNLESFQPKTPREAGLGLNYEARKRRQLKTIEHTASFMEGEFEKMAEELGDFQFGDEE